MTPRRRLALIESPGRGRNFRKMSYARASFLLSLLFLSSTQRDAARRDAMLHVCIRNAKRTMHTHERTAGRATYFCRTPSCSPLANCPSSAIPIHLFPPPHFSRVRSVLYPRERTASPFYPLSFILYPLYPGLPRQADASAPNGIMHRELVSYRLAVCLIFPIGPELRHA